VIYGSEEKTYQAIFASTGCKNVTRSLFCICFITKNLSKYQVTVDVAVLSDPSSSMKTSMSVGDSKRKQILTL